MTTVNSFADRLKSKSVKNSIINNIARDFNLTPILAEAYFNQIKDYFTEHVQLNLTSVKYTILLLMIVNLLVNRFNSVLKNPSILLCIIPMRIYLSIRKMGLLRFVNTVLFALPKKPLNKVLCFLTRI